MVSLIKNRTFKKDIENLSVDLLSGKIDGNQFCLFFDEHPKHLVWFNNFASNHLYSDLCKIDIVKKEIEHNANVKIFLYQLAEQYLLCVKREYKVLAEDYLLYIELEKQCPEWVQTDLMMLKKLYPNLNELIKSNSIKNQILRDFRYSKDKPDWLQGPEWPVIDGVVCIFNKQSSSVDNLPYDECSIEYSFINPKTNETITVVQYD